MTGQGMVRWSAFVGESRAQAGIEARRYGVPPTMIEAAAERRSAGDWRGACAAADVEFFFNPETVRRRYGAEVAGALLDDLRTLAPDLLRWHLPRYAHGSGQLLGGLLVPLAEYGGAGTGLTLAAATPGFALAAGERIVLTLLETCSSGARANTDAAAGAVLKAVHRRCAERYDWRRYRVFWDAASAPELRELCRGGALDSAAILQLQDEGRAAEAWAAAEFEVALGAPRGRGRAKPEEQRRLWLWLSSLPVNLPGLAPRVSDALPGSGEAVIRCGSGALVMSGLNGGGPPAVEVVSPRSVRARDAAVPEVPYAVWSRPLDADLLRLGLVEARDLHPLVGAAIADGAAERTAPTGWRYSTESGIEAQYADSVSSGATGNAVVLVHCGADLHRVARVDGRWRPIDHDDHAARETLLQRLGGPVNPCRGAAQHLGSGRHVIDVVARFLDHGRVAEAMRLLEAHADSGTAPGDFVLADGSTVGQRLADLREHTLRLRMTRAGAPPTRDVQSSRAAIPAWGYPDLRFRKTKSSRLKRMTRRSRKGESARLKKHR
jgi:hypothetical protein